MAMIGQLRGARAISLADEISDRGAHAKTKGKQKGKKERENYVIRRLAVRRSQRDRERWTRMEARSLHTQRDTGHLVPPGRFIDPWRLPRVAKTHRANKRSFFFFFLSCVQRNTE